MKRSIVLFLLLSLSLFGLTQQDQCIRCAISGIVAECHSCENDGENTQCFNIFESRVVLAKVYGGACDCSIFYHGERSLTVKHITYSDCWWICSKGSCVPQVSRTTTPAKTTRATTPTRTTSGVTTQTKATMTTTPTPAKTTRATTPTRTTSRTTTQTKATMTTTPTRTTTKTVIPNDDAGYLTWGVVSTVIIILALFILLLKWCWGHYLKKRNRKDYTLIYNRKHTTPPQSPIPLILTPSPSPQHVHASPVHTPSTQTPPRLPILTIEDSDDDDHNEPVAWRTRSATRAKKKVEQTEL